MRKIYIKAWLELKPYDSQTSTDLYYLRICNKVKKAISVSRVLKVLGGLFKEDDVDFLACFLTSYLEDKISETNIWNAFIQSQKRLHNKYLPFYKLENYYEDEINIPDINFLIWYFFECIQDDMFISPHQPKIIEIGTAVMDIFEDAWEYAPENEHLKTFYQIDENEDDFYLARNLIDTILFKTYLFKPDTFLDFDIRINEIIADKDSYDSEQRLLANLNDFRDNQLHYAHTRLSSLTGKEWAAEILGKNHPQAAGYQTMSKKIQGFFLYKGQNNEVVFLEHIASGMKFELLKESLIEADKISEIDTIINLGMVCWKEKWWFSGIYFTYPFNPDFVLDEKNSIKSRSQVNFLKNQQISLDQLKDQMKVFLDYNEGSQIAFMRSDKIQDFFSGFMNYYNNSLKLTPNKTELIKQGMRKAGLIKPQANNIKFEEVAETGLVFFNPKSGIEIAMSVNSAFPLPNNSFYKEDESENAILCILESNQMSTELALYCIEHCSHNLSFFKSWYGELILGDLDFFLRYSKKASYFSNPQLTTILT